MASTTTPEMTSLRATTEGASAAAAAAAAAEVSPTNSYQQSIHSPASSEQKLSVCRLLVNKLSGNQGRADEAYFIDLVVSQHSLFDLVLAVFDTMRDQSLTSERQFSHLWNITFNGKTYRNGWRHGSKYLFEPPKEELEHDPQHNHIDEMAPRFLSKLNLAEGQEGSFSGHAKFKLKVISPDYKRIPANQVHEYPKMTLQPPDSNSIVSSQMKDDWLSPEQKQAVRKLKQEYTVYYDGENAWKRQCCYPYDYIRAKPVKPDFNEDEFEMVAHMILSGAKFKKSWTAVLQYGLASRTEKYASGRWYQIAKEPYRLSQVTTDRGRRLTKDQHVVMAKRRAKECLEHALQIPAPSGPGPHPDAKIIESLRKRGSITDGMDPDTKRQKIAMFREIMMVDESGVDSDGAW